jgi:histidinol-phosphate/aromatic aminotransferase/cobyric acid decarboxylase-like protein
MVGAHASLMSKMAVPERKKIVKDVREDVLAWLDKRGMKFVPSVSNKFMLDTGRPGRAMIQALARENVYVGRVWPSWPNHIRVTIGTRAEMEKFKQALAKVTA